MCGVGLFLRRGLDHAEGVQIGVEDQILLHAFLLVLLAQRNYLFEDLGVEALSPCTISMVPEEKSIRRSGGFRFYSNASQTSALITLAQAGLQSNTQELRA